MRPRLLRRGPVHLAGRPPRSGRRDFSLTQAVAAAVQWSRSPRTRPQLPFLATPSRPSAAAPRPRYFTTKRRQWLRYEALAFAKYTLYFWAAVGCVVCGQFVLQQEWMEQAHPTPPEWSFLSRMRLRGALSERDGDDGSGSGGGGGGGGGGATSTDSDDLAADVRVVDHVKIIQILLDLLARLEDPGVDGGPGLAAAPGTAGARDIRGQSEPWRRGYFEALLAAADAAEHVEGWLRDRTRNVVCPPDMVVGPSNPHPRPLPPGASGAPREEDCEPCFPPPAELYLKLLHTRGLSTRQQIAAALAFANYLEYKQDPPAAAYVYGRAIQAAAAGRDLSADDTLLTASPSSEETPVDTWIQNWSPQHPAGDATPPVSQNLLAALTAYATFRARTGDVAAALAVFVALLQARRSLPPAQTPSSASSASARTLGAPGILARLRTLVTPPGYPPPPDDGFGPPLPGPQARCDEAALHLHIGEILYATATATARPDASWLPSFHGHDRQQQRQLQHAREEGIAWTREAVDMAEEQLHALQTPAGDSTDRPSATASATATASASASASATASARTACRQCLVAGLDNWAAMVGRLARDEERRQAAADLAAEVAAAASSASYWPTWLTFWGTAATHGHINGTAGQHKPGRWAAEENVIQDRRRRARNVLEVAAPQQKNPFSMLVA